MVNTTPSLIQFHLAMAGESDDAYSVTRAGDAKVSVGAGAPYTLTREGAEDDDELVIRRCQRVMKPRIPSLWQAQH